MSQFICNSSEYVLQSDDHYFFQSPILQIVWQGYPHRVTEEWNGMGCNGSRDTSPHEQILPTIKAGWKSVHMNPQVQVGWHELHTVTVLLDSRSYTGGNAGKSRDF